MCVITHNVLSLPFTSSFKPIIDHGLKGCAWPIFLHFGQRLANESCNQHATCRFQIDATRAQIEQLLFLELTGRRAVTAFYVVGVDFQFRFGIDLCALR